jgi:cytochrome c553
LRYIKQKKELKMKTLNKMAILFALGSVAVFAANDINNTIDAKALFEAKCATCHGAKAEKHALGKSEIIAQNGYDDIIKDLKEFKSGKGSPIMQA